VTTQYPAFPRKSEKFLRGDECLRTFILRGCRLSEKRSKCLRNLFLSDFSDVGIL
jgi:hypothetical protein